MSEKEEFKEVNESELEEEIEEENVRELAEEIYEDEEEMFKRHRLMQFLQQRSQNQGGTLSQARAIPQETALEQNIASTPVSHSHDDNFTDYSKTMEAKNEPKYSSMDSNTLSSQRQGSDLPKPELLDPMQGRGFEPRNSMEPNVLSPQQHNPLEEKDEKKYIDIELEKRDY